MLQKKVYLALFALGLSFFNPALAQEFSADLALEEGSIRTQSYAIVGQNVRIYARVLNNSTQDLFGTVKFYDERSGAFIGEDQPVSIIGGGTDDVFVDWRADSVGEYPISVRVLPWEEAGDDESNNKTTTSIYVDLDSDGDGIPNREDSDDDNDGVLDSQDAFPLNAQESVDLDGDGLGNNFDEDDDGDGVADIEDAFPLDGSETLDSDGDGVGDNADVFPQDKAESVDSDEDGLGDNADPDDANKGPIPHIETEDVVVSTGKLITFNALKATDLDGEIVTYEWDFGKGVESTSVITDTTFDKPGTYDVVLKVVDDKGEHRMKKLSITVIHRWQTRALLFIILLLLALMVYGLWRHHQAEQKSTKKPSKPKTAKKTKK